MAGPARFQPIQNRPGQFIDRASNAVLVLTQKREDDLFDTVDFPAGAVAAGTTREVFATQQGVGGALKGRQHTNLNTPRKIPGRNKMVLFRVAAHVCQATGNVNSNANDALKIGADSSFTFRLNDKLVREGALVTYPSGWGMTGNLVSATAEIHALTIGVASAPAAPKLRTPQPLNDEDSLVGTMAFDNNAWIAGGAGSMPTLAAIATVSFYLHGDIEKPSGT
jgi:hypothetical protein